MPFWGHAQKLHSFELSDVNLSESPFYQAQQTDMEYILEMDPDRLLAPYLIDAGLEPKAKRYTNWENTGLDGHIGGHYLSALSIMYAATGNQELLDRLTYMLDQLAICQDRNGNGYVGGIPDGQQVWKDIAAGKIEAANFSLNDRWVPLYNIHKIFAGLKDAYQIAGQEKAKDMLIDLTDWFAGVVSDLSDEQVQDMLRSEHGGLNEVFADVAAITGEDKYLELAKRCSHETILDPLLREEDQLTGLHANTQIPKVIGYQRIAQLEDNPEWMQASDFFWETVVNKRSVSIGGNSVREHFHPADDFSSMIESNQGPETCNTYNMLRLTKLLFLSQPEAEYIDYYERALYNHILSSQHPDGGFVYFTPMRPRHYRVYSQPHKGFWCCVGSGIENHGKYGEMIYAHSDDGLYVNLFIPSTLNWEEKGIVLEQKTDFPYQEKSTLQLKLDADQKFGLHIRYPDWVADGKFVVKVNGKKQKIQASPSSYVKIDRTWKNGDMVEVSLPMQTTLEYLPDGSPWASFIHGPLVLAAATSSEDLTGIRADDSRMGHVAEGDFYPIEKAPIIVKKSDNFLKKLRPVPNKSLAFSAGNLIYPEEYKDLELIPFFQIHDSRYMLYWRVTTPEKLEDIKQELRTQEQEMLALEARTIDQVAPGEQQPESEHNFKGEKTEIGSTRGQAWRSAEGWFSYELNHNNGQAQVLQITYFKGGWNRKFDLLINNQLFKTVELERSREEGTTSVEYSIPDSMIDQSSETLNLKFQAHEGANTGRIHKVRLLKK